MTEQEHEPAAASASERLGRYLEDFRARLARALWLRAAAVMALAALLLTVWGSWLAIRTGFADGTLALVRVVLLGVLGLLAVGLLALPLRRLRQRRERAVESLAGEFDGRLQTFGQLPAQHPFRELLAEDALGIGERHPARAHVPSARLAVPGTIGTAIVLALVWLIALGPGLYRDGARVIWAGWLLSTLRPAERIVVDPGSAAVRRGGTLSVHSAAQGFAPSAMQLHARVGNGSWQQIDMAREPRSAAAVPAGASPQLRGASWGNAPSFGFTFFSVREPVSYYVSAAGIRSPTYRLQVIDVPNVAQLRLVYHYPAWTHRPDEVQEGNGDISAIAGTRVDVQLRTDTPLPAAELVLDSTPRALATLGNEAQGTLQITRDARYYLAARIGTERVRLTEDYLIKLRPLAPPQVQVTWPGRDYSASSIEEVTTDVQASDDYGLQSLELHYSVDGGAWHTVALPVNGNRVSDEHVLALESLHPDALARPLAAGDLVSYYAVARGHALSAQSDMYFIDVQPFDRRYSQSQAAGAGGGGDEQQQIAERQRQILLSTWNLLREQQRQEQQREQPPGAAAGGAAPEARAALSDNSQLLSTLQSKLAAQADSLAGRTRARQLTGEDPTVARFIDSMKHAAEAMHPAAQRLAATDLANAVAPEQRALQYLLQADTQFKDVQVAMQNGGGGSNPEVGRDVAQLYQLEMDLQKNQYESGSGATPQSTDQQAAQLAQRLQQLARRQQQLASQLQRSQQLTAEQRWQQQSLQRDAEALQQQLQQQQQQQQQGAANGAQSGQGQSGAQGAQSGQNAQGSQGARGGQGAQGAQGGALARGGGQTGGAPVLGGGGAGTQPSGVGALPNGSDAGGPLAQRVAEAIRAMNQAANAMHGGAGDAASQARLAAQQAQLAQQALAGANNELARERAQQIQQQVEQMASRAGELYAQQAAAQRQLQAMVQSGTAQQVPGFEGLPGRFQSPQQPGRSGQAGAGGDAGTLTSGATGLQGQLTEQKRELTAGVLRLGDRVASAAQQYRNDAPGVSRALGGASQALTDSGVVDRLETEARYINEGDAAYVAGSDSAVTQALRDLQQRLQAAAGLAGQEVASASGPRDPVGDELARLRALRSQLQQLADAAQSGASGQSGATGQSGQAAQSGASQRGTGQSSASQGGETGQSGAGRGDETGQSGAGRGDESGQGSESGQSGAAAGAGGSAAVNGSQPAGGAAAGGGYGGFNGALLSGGGLGGLQGGQRAVASGAQALLPLLRAQGTDPHDLAQIDRLARELGEANIVTGRALALAQKLRAEIDVLDALELQLGQRGPQETIRAAVDNRGAEQYREAVAEYYRQLSRQ